MRNPSGWHGRLLSELNDVWPTGASLTLGEFLDVELGLNLLETCLRSRTAADAWTLFGGYPYSEVFGDVRTDAQRLRVQRARHYLWDMRRRHEWLRAVEAYRQIPQELRGYDLDSLESAPQRLEVSRAVKRFDVYEELLSSSPKFVRKPLPIAGEGEYEFEARDRRYSVAFTPELLDGPVPKPHDLASLPAGRGEPVEVSWSELEDAAATMDAIEARLPADVKRNGWAKRLAKVTLRIRDEGQGAFVDSTTLRIDRLLHLVGMVGAGKSTIRDILAFWAATKTDRRVTIVVGDVAETLSVVDQFTRLGLSAAPILGHSTRERNIERLHRRMASAGAPTMLAHQHPGFDHLSSACPLDALRSFDASRPLRIAEAPCTGLFPIGAKKSAAEEVLADEEPASKRHGPTSRPKRHGCPLWTVCPRHHAARALVDAQIWVATPASLVHSRVPHHLHAEQMRYLELVAWRSDLVIVDEADRVQMQLDTAFAPATTLVGRAPNSWLDEVAGHKVTELARQGRLQLSGREVDDWTNAVDTVSAATNRIYRLLITDAPLRRWITEEYFSAFTLHQWLINAWFPELRAGASPDLMPAGSTRQEREQALERVETILDRFRDNPLQEQQPHPTDPDTTLVQAVNRLVRLVLELLHAQNDSPVRERLRETLLDLLDQDDRISADLETHLTRFEFTLLLAALHHRLNVMTTLWPRVEAALNLEATSNVLSRRPPKDYEPVIPESPMGNVLGFQFQLGERNSDGDQSGELRFFRCAGVGRELLLALPDLPAVDDRPGPHVLLMSATSWAGTSSRYHVHAEVGAVLRPRDEEVHAVLGTEFRKEFLYGPGSTKALRLSGSKPEERPTVLQQMLYQLAVPDPSLKNSRSMFDVELDEIGDVDRRRILLLVGSYAEAKNAFDYLDTIPEWKGRVARLISDDADLDHAWQTMPGNATGTVLRRGEVSSFAQTGAEILVAPLLAIERGHNILVPGGKAAIGSVYFLARPHPRPDDISLAVQAINDWAVRQVRGPDREFEQAALAAGTPDQAGLNFRRRARKKWNRFLTRQLSWTSLPDDEKIAFTWDQLVAMWQVIGRLVRGGVPARVAFVDAAFSPREAGLNAVDTPDTSLLVSMREVLASYFTPNSAVPAIDRSLVTALYEPLYQALAEMD